MTNNKNIQTMKTAKNIFQVLNIFVDNGTISISSARQRKALLNMGAEIQQLRICVTITRLTK